jgi:hypothetical protein
VVRVLGLMNHARIHAFRELPIATPSPLGVLCLLEFDFSRRKRENALAAKGGLLLGTIVGTCAFLLYYCSSVIPGSSPVSVALVLRGKGPPAHGQERDMPVFYSPSHTSKTTAQSYRSVLDVGCAALAGTRPSTCFVDEFVELLILRVELTNAAAINRPPRYVQYYACLLHALQWILEEHPQRSRRI